LYLFGEKNIDALDYVRAETFYFVTGNVLMGNKTKATKYLFAKSATFLEAFWIEASEDSIEFRACLADDREQAERTFVDILEARLNIKRKERYISKAMP
jgi:hypothetical protein